MFSLFKKNKLSFFPWRKKKIKLIPADQFMAMSTAYLPVIKNLLKELREDARKEIHLTDGQRIGRMYDFYEDAMQTTVFPINPFDNSGITAGGSEPSKQKIEAKPVDVVAELETVPDPVSLEGLDEKIALFKTKSKISTQRYAKAEVDGFIKRLENRKHYKANHQFYGAFPNTTDDKIQALLDKYKLVMKESELFVPTFPKEAIDVMEKYTEVTEAFCKQKPVFYVIAEDKDFQKKFKKLDPILLVQSPFGFFWQILGAWDKEMLLLSEL